MSKLDELNRQYQDTLDAYNQETNADARRQLEDELKRRQADIEAAKMAGIAEEVMSSDQPYTLIVGGAEINFRDYIHDEAAYQVIAIAVSQKIHELEQQRIKEVEAANEHFRQECKQYQKQIEALNGNHDLEIAEMDSKLQAAADEIADLKRQLVVVPKPEPVATNLNGNLKEAIAKANAAKPAIYDVEGLDMLSKRFRAKLLETDETVEFGYLERGKYREASEDEVARFHEERAKREAEMAAIQSAEDAQVATVEPPQLPSQFQNEDAGVPEHTTDGEMAVGEDIPETFEQEVRRRLDELERVTYGTRVA